MKLNIPAQYSMSGIGKDGRILACFREEAASLCNIEEMIEIRTCIIGRHNTY